jgi:hypothetical protein
MVSLFDNLYKYKQSEKGRHQKENFLTEIFAHCLEFDETFRKNFLYRIGYTNGCVGFLCKTQVTVEGFGIPDVCIEIGDHTKIIIECKIGSIQGKNQLEKYALSLIKDKAINKHLIYLTKSPESIPALSEFDKKVKFKHFRWYDIYEFLQESTNELSIEFSKYLKEHQMNKLMVSFTNKDANAISSIAKMKSFLQRLEAILKTDNPNKIQFPNNIDELSDWGCYALRTDFGEGKLWFGFYQEDDEEIKLYIEYIVPSSSRNRKRMATFSNLNSWEPYDYGDGNISWYNSKYLSAFINDGKFSADGALDFFKNRNKEN